MSPILTLVYPFIVFAVVCLLLCFVIMPVNTLIHELGHAIPFAAFSKGPIQIFVGSYGDEQGSFRFRLGRFVIWLQRNPLHWRRGGLCKYADKRLPVSQRIAGTLGGPVATLLLFCGLLSYVLIIRPQGMLAPFWTLFCIYAGLSFLYNIIPLPKVITLKGGAFTYNDGAAIESLLKERRMPPAWFEMVAYYEAEKYEYAAEVAKKLIAQKVKNVTLYRMAVVCFIKMKEYRTAAAIQQLQMDRFGSFNEPDKVNKALLKIYMGRHEEAIRYLQHLLQVKQPNKYNLNNLAFVLALSGRAAEGIPYLDKALKTDPDFSYAYSNKAYAQLTMEQFESAKENNELALQLDPGNAYAYRNKGIYLLHFREYEAALVALEHAAKLDPHIESLNQLINETSGHLSYKMN